MTFDYVTKPTSRLFCAICQDVFHDPLISVVCNHSFCNKCITESLRLEAHCPLCRKYLHASDLHTNLVLKSITDELTVYCPNRFLGCQVSTTREVMDTHSRTCEFNLGKCPNMTFGCSFEGSGVSVQRHVGECVYETLKSYLIVTEERFASLHAVIEAQQSEITKLKKQIASGVVGTQQTALDPLDDEEEIIVPKTKSFPHGQTIECRRTISENKTGVTSLAYTNTNTLISGAYDGCLKLFNAETGKMTRSFSAHDLSVWAIATEEESNRFFSAGSDGKIKVWHLDNSVDDGDECLKTLTEHQRKVYSLQLSNGRLYSAASDGKIKIWSTENLTCETTIQAHGDCINSIVLLENDPTKMISVSSDRTLKLWDLTTATAIHSFPDIGSEGLDVTSGGGMIFASTFDASIVSFEMDSYSRVRTLRGHNWEVWQVKYVDGVLFSGSFDHTIKRWDLNTFTDDLTLKGHKGYVHSFRFGSDCLISAGADKTIKIWK
ncbi:UNVERIFIED_CONTAM: E3 ubiquitin-protein ligase traf7 [Siphonaria sp. JEL0065]|nr:E3 ubiquitin-protein ligase traf7 [Siphonaria sp. JEL0065]